MRNIALLDLDGTIIDSLPGIVSSMTHALNQLGITPPAYNDFTRFIGPPLDDAFHELLETDDVAAVDGAVSLYREYYQDRGMFECKPYDGVREMIEFAATHCARLCLVTSKPEPYAKQLLEHFELVGHFNGIYGATFDPSRARKTDVLRYSLNESGVSPDEAVMIGDRDQDLLAAKDNKTASIGVLWGYGSRSELDGCNPDAIAATPAEVIELLQQSDK